MNLPPEQMESARNGRFHLKITQIGIEIHASNSIRVSRTSAPDVLKVSTVKAIQSKKNQRRPRFSDRRGWVEAAVLRFWINGFQCIGHCVPVADLSARGVDQIRSALHFAEQRCIE